MPEKKSFEMKSLGKLSKGGAKNPGRCAWKRLLSKSSEDS